MRKRASGKDPLRPTPGDHIHTAVRTALSVVPEVGGPLVEAFQAAFTPPLVRRRDDWIRKIAADLEELTKTVDGLSFEKLSQDEAFISALSTASQIALRTHQKEKIEALRSAVKNAAQGKCPDDNLRSIYLNLVDRFTPLHLAILSVAHAPESSPGVSNKLKNITAGGFSTVIETALPELQGQRVVYDLLWKDLYDAGLVNGPSPHGMMTVHGLREKHTTSIGSQFFEFVSSE